MSKPDIEQLDYLHDAVVHEISWQPAQDSRTLRMTFICDEECECPDWAGKKVIVTCIDVLIGSAVLLGHVVGQDTFDSFREDLSPSMLEDLQKLINMGISRPQILLRIALHSGSELQIACHGIAIDIASP